MSEQQITVPSASPEMLVYGQDNSGQMESSSSSSLWTWLFVMFLFGLFILGVYYYLLYFYDASSMEDAIEKAFKHFNEKSEAAREDVGLTGDTGATEEQVTFKKVLVKALDNAINEDDEDEKEGFEAMGSSDSSLGKLNWCLLDEQNQSNQIVDSNMCMSGNIFPSRDICINPTLRTL
jgi:hypothetical protein